MQGHKVPGPHINSTIDVQFLKKKDRGISGGRREDKKSDNNRGENGSGGRIEPEEKFSLETVLQTEKK